MSEAFNEFDERLRNISRKRARTKNGYVTVVGRDGLILLKPRQRRASFPWKGVMLLGVGFIGFKALLMAHLGFGNYQDRVTELENGGLVEMAGAVIMHQDPLSVYLAKELRPFLK